MENIIANKSYAFAIRIIRLYKFFIEEKKEFILSKQLLRSGTAIGALVKEAEHAQSKYDSINADSSEILRLLISIVKSTKTALKK